MNPPESDDNRDLCLTVTEKRRRVPSPESDDNEEMGLGLAEKRQRTVSDDEDAITVVKDFLAEYNNPFVEETVMEVMKGLEEEITCPGNNNNMVTAFPSLLSVRPISSSIVTINGGSESCGASFSDSSSSLMASMDVGVHSISAYLMWDLHVLQDWALRMSSVIDQLVRETEQNEGGGQGGGGGESSSFDLERRFLSLKMGENGQDDDESSGFDLNQLVLRFEEESLSSEEESFNTEQNGDDLDHGCLILSDSTIKTEQNVQEEGSSSSSGCLSLSDSSIKTEENEQEEEESSSGCLSLSDATIKTEEEEEEEEQEEINNGCDVMVEEETIDEWIERVLKEIPFDFKFEMEV